MGSGLELHNQELGKGRAEWALVTTAGSVRRPTYSTQLEWTPGFRCIFSKFQTLERGSEFSLGYLITLDTSATVHGWCYIIQTWSWRTIPNVGTSNWASHPQGSSTTGNMPNTPFIPDARLAASNFFLRCNRTILILSYHLLASNPLILCSATLGRGSVNHISALLGGSLPGSGNRGPRRSL